MKLRLCVYFLFGLVTLSACQSAANPQSGTAAPSGPAQNYQYVFSPASNAVNLSLTLDTAHSAEGVIPLKGGQVQATGSDGTLYTLDIPADALASQTKITITPASGVSGLPFGKQQPYAVQLSPDGLFLYKDAILTITPPQPIAPDRQILFGFKAGGQAPTLALPVVDSKEIKIRLMHFSGYGVTEGSMTEVAPVAQQLGGDPQSRLESLTAQVLADERQRQQSGASPDNSLGQTVLGLMDQYEQQVVKPALEAAQSSCASGKEAINQVIGLERMRQLLGVKSKDSLGADITSLLSAVGKVCVQEEYKRCVDQHVINTMIPLWLGLLREYQLLGGAESGPEPEEVKLAEVLTRQCLTFELQFDSKGKFDAGGGGYDAAVKSVVRLQFDSNDFTIKGDAPLESVSFNFNPPKGCTANSKTGGGAFQVSSLEYIQDTHSDTDTVGYVRDFKLVYWPGVSSESYTVDCPPKKKGDQPAHYTSPPSGYWSGMYFALHGPELNAAGPGGSGASANPGGVPSMPDLSAMLGAAQAGAMPAFPAPSVPEGSGFVLDNWTVSGGALFASKEWIKDSGGLGVTESGTFKLYHKPGN